VKSWLREAAAAARTGDLDEAERLYRWALEKDPENVEAWLGLGTVLTEPRRKADCFKRVLEIDPDNEDAAASLARLQAVLPAEESEVVFCDFHPNVETVLRCSQCGRPICVRCAQPYPVGQLCPVCVRGRRPLYYQADPIQLTMAGAATLAAAAVTGLLASFVVRWSLFLAILAGPAAGSLLARVILWAGQKRRGLVMQITAGACIVVGSLIGRWLGILLGFGVIGLGYSLVDLSFLLYIGLATASAVAWLR
jgi:tetratricopeptide (TPR) repeat protein